MKRLLSLQQQLDDALPRHDQAEILALLEQGACPFGPLPEWQNSRRAQEKLHQEHSFGPMVRVAANPLTHPGQADTLKLLTQWAVHRYPASHVQPALDLAMHMAACQGQRWAVAILLAAGANARFAYQGASAITASVNAGSIEGVKQLLQAGADLDQRDKYGRAPLECAIEQGRYSLAHELLDLGAPAVVVGDDGSIWSPALCLLVTREAEWGTVEERRILAQRLTQLGAPLDGVFPAWGTTPLGATIQSEERYRVGAEILLSLGADPRWIAVGKRSALEVAQASESPLLPLLEAAVHALELEKATPHVEAAPRRRF